MWSNFTISRNTVETRQKTRKKEERTTNDNLSLDKIHFTFFIDKNDNKKYHKFSRKNNNQYERAWNEHDSLVLLLIDID